MIRYLVVPDSLGDLAIRPFVEALFSDPRFTAQPLSIFQAHDLRAKLLIGGLVELTEPEHQVLSACVTNPASGQGMLLSGIWMLDAVQAFCRAIVDASSAKPGPPAE